MKTNRILQGLALAVCAVSLVCSALLVTLRHIQVATPPPAPAYTVTEDGGHLAVISAEGAKQVYNNVYTYLLPEDDIEMLRKGIPVYSEAELRALLEDFGL